MVNQIILEFYEQRPSRFSALPERVKVAELEATHMSYDQFYQIREIQEMLGRTYEIKRIG